MAAYLASTTGADGTDFLVIANSYIAGVDGDSASSADGALDRAGTLTSYARDLMASSRIPSLFLHAKEGTRDEALRSERLSGRPLVHVVSCTFAFYCLFCPLFTK